MGEIFKLRKTLGPLSPGTELEVIWLSDTHARVRLHNLGGPLRDQLARSRGWGHLAVEFEIPADLVVEKRERQVL